MKYLPFLSLLALLSCAKEKPIDLQGHRGARGLMPENSIPGFILATEMGVNTLELDLVVSKDNKLVVSHEPYFSKDFCLDTLGKEIPRDSIINMYQLSYSEIQKFDCGSHGNERFPEQQKIKTFKPLLEAVIDSIEAFTSRNNLPQIRYNIELKTREETDDIFHPDPVEFSNLVYSLLAQKQLLDRVTIQSFDFRTLQYFRKTYPEINLAALVENDQPWHENIKTLGFTPGIYSCYYELLSRESTEEIQKAGMKVIPWTVNETSDMQTMLDWGVDGLITDYPDRAIKVINKD